MKKAFVILAAMASFVGASAQSDLLENPDNEAYFGVRIGVDVSSTAGGPDYYNNGAGFTAGAVYNIPVYKNLYFEPGLSLFYNTFGQEITTTADPYNAPVSINGSIRNFGFRIPIVAGYFFDFTDDIRVAPFTGPQLNCSLIARDHWNADIAGDKLHSGSVFGEYGFKHFDVQWVFGVGVTYRDYYMSISGGVGITKIMDTSYESFRRNTFNISLGYNF